MAPFAYAYGESKTYIPDLTHSHIGFEIEHFGFSRTVGSFNQFDGVFILDVDKKALTKIEVSIETASIDTNHAKRDQHLLAEDFFNQSQFPQMTFSGQKIIMHDGEHGVINGDLTILGVTKPIQLDFNVRKIGTVPIPAYQKAETIGIEAQGVIKRSDFGMDKFLGPIGDEVYLNIHLDLVDCNPSTQSSPACQR
ncbi:MAG: YceI family protein [Pseudomonadota bacterium]